MPFSVSIFLLRTHISICAWDNARTVLNIWICLSRHFVKYNKQARFLTNSAKGPTDQKKSGELNSLSLSACDAAGFQQNSWLPCSVLKTQDNRPNTELHVLSPTSPNWDLITVSALAEMEWNQPLGITSSALALPPAWQSPAVPAGKRTQPPLCFALYNFLVTAPFCL